MYKLNYFHTVRGFHKKEAINRVYESNAGLHNCFDLVHRSEDKPRVDDPFHRGNDRKRVESNVYIELMHSDRPGKGVYLHVNNVFGGVGL